MGAAGVYRVFKASLITDLPHRFDHPTPAAEDCSGNRGRVGDRRG